MNLIRRNLDVDKAVIVIDEDLETGAESFIEAKHKDKCLVFNEWTVEKVSNISTKLKLLNAASGAMVVHTNMDGCRGVDFKLNEK